VKRQVVFKMLRYSGMPFLFREVIHRSQVTVLLFHDIPKEKAECVFGFLRRTYNVISLSTFVEKCRSGRNDLPPKSLILTFDDGYISNKELLPLVKEKKVPVTIFLCAGVIDTSRHFWCSRCSPRYAVSQLQRLPNAERLRLLRSIGFTPEREYEEPQALTKGQIDEMRPYFDFQAHTLFHPSLPRCSDEEARREIFECKRILEEKLDLKVEAISYPHGDYSDRDIELCRQAGYQCGFTSDHGFNTTKADLFRLKRICIDDADGIDELAVKASGVWAFVRNLTRRALG
jgi:peptidoglycan/xylan/chitin deacetylase (PgdA/CDA1 family)